MTIPEIMERVREMELNEERGPVVYCQSCFRSKVQFDWRKERQVCPTCERVAA